MLSPAPPDTVAAIADPALPVAVALPATATPLSVDAPALSAPGNRTTRYQVRHLTRYRYGDRVSVSHHILHLVPRPHPRQVCDDPQIRIVPAPAARADWCDYFGNPTSYCEIREPHLCLEIESTLQVTVQPPTIDLAATPAWELVRAQTQVPVDDDDLAAAAMVFDSLLVRATPDLCDYARPSFTTDRPIGAAVMDLTRRIFRDFRFDATATSVSTPLAEVLNHRRGVCQDFAHLGIGCLRALGLPARYVSGYLRTLPPQGRPRLIGADASHAWFAAWCGPAAGWIDFDPTNDRTADANYISIAWGRDYDDVSPVRGVILGGAWHELTVAVDVEPLDELPPPDETADEIRDEVPAADVAPVP
ncbi:MAG: transglutaminase family protein [Azospirillaceae bacterium]|nr:transglutaminase family protein [Azospirillaceae bacterium]